MNGIFWIVVGAMTGWLTGTFMGKEGYGKSLLGGYTRSLDIFFGHRRCLYRRLSIFLGCHQGKPALFSIYATAVFGSVTLVGLVRLISTRNLAWVRNYRFEH